MFLTNFNVEFNLHWRCQIWFNWHSFFLVQFLWIRRSIEWRNVAMPEAGLSLLGRGWAFRVVGFKLKLNIWCSRMKSRWRLSLLNHPVWVNTKSAVYSVPHTRNRDSRWSDAGTPDPFIPNPQRLAAYVFTYWSWTYARVAKRFFLLGRASRTKRIYANTVETKRVNRYSHWLRAGSIYIYIYLSH